MKLDFLKFCLALKFGQSSHLTSFTDHDLTTISHSKTKQGQLHPQGSKDVYIIIKIYGKNKSQNKEREKKYRIDVLG